MGTFIDNNCNLVDNKINNNNHREPYHRSLVAASASNSVVSGTGVTTFAKQTMSVVTVTAKDSSGNTITTGGEKFLLKVSNVWTKKNNYYWEVGTSFLFSPNIYILMTDNNDGTYTASYTVGSGIGMTIYSLNIIIGDVSAQVYLLKQGSIYHEYYNGDIKGSSIASWTVNGIAFSDSSMTNYCRSNGENVSAKIIAAVKSPYTGNVSFNFNCGYYCTIIKIIVFDVV